MKIGYTTGVYDLFHIGHLNLLERAKAACDKLIVGITTDELLLEYKGKRPVIPFKERMKIIESIKYVDAVVAQKDMDKFAMWKKLKFDVMFVGDDWRGTPKWNQFEEQFKKVGVEIVYFPYTKGTSSTLINELLVKERIKNAEIIKSIEKQYSVAETKMTTDMVGFDKIGMDRIAEELEYFYNFMHEIGEDDYFLIGGLLLFLVRDKKIQDYDKDFDFRLHGEERLTHILDEELTKYRHYDSAHISEAAPHHGKILWLKKQFDDYESVLPIEISAQYEKGDTVFFNRQMYFNDAKPSWKYKEGRLVWPKRLFESLGTLKYNGMAFKIPSPPEEWLAIFYGEDWKTPAEWGDWRYGCYNLHRGYW